MKGVLVVVDMQNKFLKDYNAERIIPAVAEKIKQRRKEGYEVVFTFDAAGGETVEEIYGQCGNSKIYNKHTYGSAELVLDLKNLNPKKVEFAGVCTDVCVIVNVLATMAFLPFSEIVVDANCCASQPEKHLAALKIMKSCNVTVI